MQAFAYENTSPLIARIFWLFEQSKPLNIQKAETEVSACSFSYSLAHYAVNVIVIVALVFETLSMRMSKLTFLLSFLA